jgi:hypothetical protein
MPRVGRRTAGLATAAVVAFAAAAYGSASAGRASAACDAGPQGGTLSVGGPPHYSREGMRASLTFTAGAVPPVAGSTSFTFSGPNGSQTVGAESESVKAALSSIVMLPVGTYTVSAQWQVGCDDGSLETRTAPSLMFDVIAFVPLHATPVFGSTQPRKVQRNYVQAGAGIACYGSMDPADFVDERISVDLFLTLDGSLPATSSRRHYRAPAPHGCHGSRTANPSHSLSLPEHYVTVASHPGSMNVAMAFPSRARVVRALFMVASGRKRLGTLRVRLVHARGGHVVLLRDKGPCPSPCLRHWTDRGWEP